MTYIDTNVQSNPGQSGLRTVAELELSEPCWSFDTVIVWADEHGHLWWAHDEGCSCPTPFDGFQLGDQIRPLRNDNDYGELVRFTERAVKPGDRGSFLYKVRRGLSDPDSVAFDRVAWEAENKKTTEDEKIRSELWKVAEVLGYKTFSIPNGSADLSALVDKVPRDINVFQAHVLGTYLAGVAENAIAQAEAKQPQQ